MKFLLVSLSVYLLFVFPCEANVVNIHIDVLNLSAGSAGSAGSGRSNGNDTDYVFLDHQEVNWFKAHQLCQAAGMKLASISSAADNEKMRLVLENNIQNGEHYAWTSGAKTESNGAFSWVRNGEKMNYSKWAPQYPSKAQDALCMCIGRDSLWYNCVCRSKYFYVCQRDSNTFHRYLANLQL